MAWGPLRTGRRRDLLVTEVASAPSVRYGGKKGTGRHGFIAFLRKRKALAERLAVEKAVADLKAVAEAVRDPSVLAHALCHRDFPVRFQAVMTVSALADRGVDVSALLPQLVAGLSDEEKSVRAHCGWILGKAAKNGTGISKAIPVLAATLSNDGDVLVKRALSFALCVAGENGADLHPARDALMAASTNDDETVRSFASDALFCLRP